MGGAVSGFRCCWGVGIARMGDWGSERVGEVIDVQHTALVLVSAVLYLLVQLTKFGTPSNR